MNKAIGDRQVSKKEAMKLRKQLDLFLEEEEEDGENTDVLFQNFDSEQHEVSLLWRPWEWEVAPRHNERFTEKTFSKVSKHDNWEEKRF